MSEERQFPEPLLKTLQWHGYLEIIAQPLCLKTKLISSYSKLDVM